MLKKCFWIAALLSLVLAMLACSSEGSLNAGQKIGDASHPAPTITNTQQESFKLGDIIQFSRGRITLNSFVFNNGEVQINFTWENTTKNDFTVSSLIDFSAKDQNGNSLDQDIAKCPSLLDGKLLSGHILRGNICFRLKTDGPITLYFKNNLFEPGSIAWNLKPPAIQSPIATPQ